MYADLMYFHWIFQIHTPLSRGFLALYLHFILHIDVNNQSQLVHNSFKLSIFTKDKYYVTLLSEYDMKNDTA
mgnify:CR=1 FL=1